MVHEVVFDSKNYPEGKKVGLAAGLISLTKIEFTNENIVVFVEAKTGEIDFCDMNENKLFSTKVKVPSSGDEKFSDLMCVADGNEIKLGFPQYYYEDTYPNCDGEYDRWIKKISGYEYITYNFNGN